MIFSRSDSLVAASTRTLIGTTLRIAHAAKLALLQHAQQFRLQRKRHRVDLIEEDGALLGFLEEPDLVLDRAGERALLVAEQLGLEQVLRQAPSS